MRIIPAMALCLVTVMGHFGGAISGALDVTAIPSGHEDGSFGLDSASMGMEASLVYPARVPKTGQTTSYGPRDDGKLQKGVAWPSPRFTDNGNGTVRDNLTGLIWLKNADCEQFYEGDTLGQNYRNWRAALNAANKLANGYCGLADGSKAGQWRLPNIKELHSLMDFGFDHPALPNTVGTGQWTEGDPFSGVLSSSYWSSTTRPHFTNSAWFVDLDGGYVGLVGKTSTYHVWPVRGGY